MIIVKTSNGDVLINDREMVKLCHDKENHFVYVTMKGNTGFSLKEKPIEKVEGVTYINEATATERKDDGSHVKFLQEQLDDEKIMVGWLNSMCKQLESKLCYFASDIINIAQRYDEIPDEIRKRLRETAEEQKEFANDESKWWERRQYTERMKKAARADADTTATLNEQVEQQAARILELEANLAKAKHDSRAYQEANERIMQRTLWQRIKNERTWIW